ncbi:MAG: FAD-dependent oxidoreductase [Bacteroidota bacterium]
MALLPWRKGIVIKIENETLDTKRFWIQVPELESFDFKPGQFVTLDLPIHEKLNKRWRSYSISSWPDGSNIFELLIVLNSFGLGTPYLFNEISIGSELVFRGAQGVFTLHEPLEKDLYLVCTGTGIAPFRSMVQDIRRKEIAYKNIFLLYGCRRRENLMYHEEMLSLEKEMNNFHFIPTLSREEWDGRKGYVHSIYEELCSAKSPANFFLCGWKDMIDEARKRIIELGYDKKDIHVEIYG